MKSQALFLKTFRMLACGWSLAAPASGPTRLPYAPPPVTIEMRASELQSELMLGCGLLAGGFGFVP